MNNPFQTHSFYAMGSTIQVWIEASAQNAQDAFITVEDCFRKYELIFTRFDPASELCRINRAGGGSVSAVFYSVVEEALRWADRTQGYYDPTLLQPMEQAGYATSFEQNRVFEATLNPTSRHRLHHGYHHVLLNERCPSVWLFDNVMLDLNGIVKGWTAQRARDCIRSVGACLIDAGGDIIAGDTPVNTPGWLVSIATPNDGSQPEQDLYGIYLSNATMATSGVDYRKWTMNDTPMHHLIDPFTGEPARNQTQTVTVIAEDACCAEAWATAGCVMGSDKGRSLFDANNIAGCFIDTEEVSLTTAMMPQIAGIY